MDTTSNTQHQWQLTLKKIITKFIQDLEYQPMDPIPDSNATYQAVKLEFSTRYDNGQEWYKQMYRTAVTMSEKSLDSPGKSRFLLGQFVGITQRTSKIISFLLHVDDLGKEFSSLENLRLNILLGDSTEGAFYEAFRKHLIGFYQFYDPIPANAITLSPMDCINGMLLEQRDTIRDIKLSDSARSWPNYLRNKTGCSEAYAFMHFPKAMKLDLSVYITVIDDIVFFINSVNDILSFYKEYLGGERDTYVFLRARIANKPLNETLRDVVSESLAAHARVSKALQHTSAISTWKQFVNGYLGFHFTLARYRLTELGF